MQSLLAFGHGFPETGDCTFGTRVGSALILGGLGAAIGGTVGGAIGFFAHHRFVISDPQPIGYRTNDPIADSQ